MQRRKLDRYIVNFSSWVLVIVCSFVTHGTHAENVHKDQGGRYSGELHATRSAIIAQHGMAATSQPLATQIALDILKSGGNAVDAAIAANAALGLMEPTGSGIGGDLFVIVWDPATQKLYALNASGRSPSGQTLSQLQDAIKKRQNRMFLKVTTTNPAAMSENTKDDTIPDWGAIAVTIPGTVDGWFTLHQRFGRLSMSRILTPTIGYARNGFPVSELIAESWAEEMSRFRALYNAGEIEEIANLENVFLSQGMPPAQGDLFRNPDLANTLSQIATEGRNTFYSGSIAHAMDRYFRRIGSPIRAADLAAHRSVWVEPVSTNYRGYDVWELPPNSQGIAALQMLNILEGYNLKAMGRKSPIFWHVLTEAKKQAFADRARFYADPDFAKVPVAELISKERAARQRAAISLHKASKTNVAVLPVDGSNDTIYLTVADSDGMMVSLIQSNYIGMGSGLVPDNGAGQTLGFILQNRGAQFSLDPHHPNVYAPGKRPFHTIIPGFVTKKGKPLMSFGVMGGTMQPQGHAQIIINMIDFGMGVQAAGDAARLHHDGSPDPESGAAMQNGGVVELESGISNEIAEALRMKGHNVRYAIWPFGGYQAIWRDPETGFYWGASEFRMDGQAAGY
jgi:gamma-glutamyltranspeptidase / glutathione hydrolase